MHANGPEDLWRKNNGFKTQGVTVSSWLIISFKFFIYLLSVDNQLFTMIDLFINSSSYLFLLNSLFRRFLPDAGTGELTDTARLAAYFNTYRNTLADLTDVRDHAD